MVERLHLLALYRISATSDAMRQTMASGHHVEPSRLLRELKRGERWNLIGEEYILLLDPIILNRK